MSVQQFIDDLGLDLAAEQVGENPDLPFELRAEATAHYRLDIMRYDPYRSEHFVISGKNTPHQLAPQLLLISLAYQMAVYRAHPEPSDWCAYAGLPDLPGVHEAWHTFARDEAKLERLFGDDMDRFLTLDPRREV